MAFASRRESDRKWRIYLGWVLGLEETHELAFGTRPAWSPDGRSLVFQGCIPSTSNCGLISLNADGSNFRLLTSSPGDTAPSLSPDGSKIAFMSAERDGNWEIYVLELKTGKINRLTTDPDIDGLPVWSPDGRCLAFLSHRGGKWGLYTMQANGSDVRLLTTLSESIGNWMDHNISWGP
jgi:TolB protein